MQIASALGTRSMVATLREVAALPEGLLQRALGTARSGGIAGSNRQRRRRYRPSFRTEWFARSPMTLYGRSGRGSGCTNASFTPWRATRSSPRRTGQALFPRRAFQGLDQGVHLRPERGAKEASPGWCSPMRRPTSRLPWMRSTGRRFRGLAKIEAIDLLDRSAHGVQWGSGKVVEWLQLGKEAERRSDLIGDIGRKVAAMTV